MVDDDALSEGHCPGQSRFVRRSLRAVFLDRDGVINEDIGYVHRPEDFRLLPGVPETLRALRASGFALVVVTNQAGIGRGLYGEDDYQRLTRHMREVLQEEGILLDDVRHCPHHPTQATSRYRCECACRKPEPGMLKAAAAGLGIDLAQSFLIGDKITDVLAGRRAGLKGCVLVTTGHRIEPCAGSQADACFDSLVEAGDWILNRAKLSL